MQAGMFQALGSQVWEREQGLGRQTLPGARMHRLKLGPGGLLVGPRR